MRRYLAIALLTASLIPAPRSFAEAGDTETEAAWSGLKGQWDVVSLTIDGDKLEPRAVGFNECLILAPKPGVKDGTSSVGWLIFTLDKRLFEEWPMYRFDHESRPPRFSPQTHAPNLLNRASEGIYHHHAIYRLIGDELTICIGLGEGIEEPTRPDDFTAKLQSRRTLITLRRRPAEKLAR